MTLSDKNEVTIRIATEADAELIADLSRQTFYESFSEHNSKDDMDKFMNEQFTREKLINEVNEPWQMFFLAYINNEPVGYVKLRDGAVPVQLDIRSSLEIARIYAVRNKIGKGI